MSARLSEKDLALLAQYPDVPIIDTSDRRAHRHCLQYWDFTSRLREGLQSKRTSIPLLFGTAIHDALDRGYSRDDGCNYDYYAMANWFGIVWDKEVAKLGKLWPDEQRRYDEARALGVAMLEEYAHWAPAQDDFEVVETEHAGLVPIIKPHDVVLDRQVPFGVDDDGDIVVGLYYFRTDGIVRDRDGRLWVLEHKTCADWWDPIQLALDDQITSYLWAEGQWYGQPMTGVVMNFLKKKEVHDPEILKSGLPTTDKKKLAYVTSSRYHTALARVAHTMPANKLPVYDGLLTELQKRDDAAGHPTLRREKPIRTPDQVARQGERIFTELMEMTREDKPIYPTSDTHNCPRCEMKELCLMREADADWRSLADETHRKRDTFLGLEAAA